MKGTLIVGLAMLFGIVAGAETVIQELEWGEASLKIEYLEIEPEVNESEGIVEVSGTVFFKVGRWGNWDGYGNCDVKVIGRWGESDTDTTTYDGYFSIDLYAPKDPGICQIQIEVNGVQIGRNSRIELTVEKTVLSVNRLSFYQLSFDDISIHLIKPLNIARQE